MRLGAISRWPEHTFPPGTYDVRGWVVRTRADDEKAGAVHDILVDRLGVPRFLDVDLGIFRKHVLLPIAKARADRERQVVWVPGHTREQLRELPAFEHESADDPEAVLASAELAARASERRASYPGTVYGPSEVEDRVTTPEMPRLAPLREIEDHYAIPDDQPDPRDWVVLVGDGSPVGAVAELIIDTSALKVRHLVCRVDPAALGVDGDDHVILIPVGHVRLDEPNQNVLLDAVDRDDLREMPEYSPEALGPELERASRSALEPRPLATEPGEEYRDARHFYGLESE